MSDYWNTYNADSDFSSLMPPLFGTPQQPIGGNLQTSSAGYDPVWVYQTFGDRLRLLPTDLYDAVFEAMRGGTNNNQFLSQYISVYSGGAALNAVWATEARSYLPELQ